MRGWQNLKAPGDGNLIHGRAWWEPRSERGQLSAEWRLGVRDFSGAVSFQVGGGDSGSRLLVSLRVPRLGALYLGLDHPRLAAPFRELSLRFFDAAIWWHLWVDPDSWESSRPRWRDGCLRFADLLGPQETETRVLRRQTVGIELPEGLYRAEVLLTETTQRRPRWPWPRRYFGAEIIPEVPVPVPGQGENPWDCEDDAHYRAYYAGVDSVFGAVERFRTDVLEVRRRRGGDRWCAPGTLVPPPPAGSVS